MTRNEVYNRLDAVEHQFAATHFAISYVDAQVRRTPTILPPQPPEIRSSHFRQALLDLEGTYLLRLFSVFENALRDYWSSLRPRARSRQTAAEVLINRVADRLSIPGRVVTAVHEVREQRNRLVHDLEKRNDPLGLPACVSHLCRYLSFLPIDW